MNRSFEELKKIEKKPKNDLFSDSRWSVAD
jgi:hypothetical protein